MRVMKRKIKVFEDLDNQILEDYIRDIYNDVKQNEDKDNAEIIQGFEAERQLELRDRIMEEINGYRRILLYVNLYDEEIRDSLENKIYNRIKDLVIFEDLIEN